MRLREREKDIVATLKDHFEDGGWPVLAWTEFHGIDPDIQIFILKKLNLKIRDGYIVKARKKK